MKLERAGRIVGLHVRDSAAVRDALGRVVGRTRGKIVAEVVVEDGDDGRGGFEVGIEVDEVLEQRIVKSMRERGRGPDVRVTIEVVP